MGDEGFQIIINSNSLKKLTELAVAGNSISREGLLKLAKSPLLPHLKTIDLRRNNLKDADQIFLAQSTEFDNLEALRF